MPNDHLETPIPSIRRLDRSLHWGWVIVILQEGAWPEARANTVNEYVPGRPSLMGGTVKPSLRGVLQGAFQVCSLTFWQLVNVTAVTCTGTAFGLLKIITATPLVGCCTSVVSGSRLAENARPDVRKIVSTLKKIAKRIIERMLGWFLAGCKQTIS